MALDCRRHEACSFPFLLLIMKVFDRSFTDTRTNRRFWERPTRRCRKVLASTFQSAICNPRATNTYDHYREAAIIPQTYLYYMCIEFIAWLVRTSSKAIKQVVFSASQQSTAEDLLNSPQTDLPVGVPSSF